MKVKQVCEELLGGRKYPLTSLLGEVIEALQALLKPDFKEFLGEFRQIIFELQIHIHQTTGADFDLLFCTDVINEGYLRRKVWIELFSLFDIPFHNKYLINGSNFRRAHKIKAAFKLAGLRLNVLHAVSLSEKYKQIYPDNPTKGIYVK